MSGSEILINQLFAGRYLSEGDNIGHEVINLFEDDSGTHYLYVTPSGVVNGHDVEYAIFVRNIKARTTVEVIAIGMGLSPVSVEEASEICFGGVPLNRIFRGNTYHGEQDTSLNNATFSAEKVVVPAGGARVLLTVDDGFNLSDWPNAVLLETDKKVVIPQGMRSYFSRDSEPRAYKQLQNLIADTSLWQPVGAAGKLVTDGLVNNQALTFLEIIGKEDDELAFSNLLAYYFGYNRAAFGEFASDDELLGIPDMGLEYSIVRESNHNIDLWIEDEHNVIVIENKIRSGINGFDSAGRSQLDKYRMEAEGYAISCGKKAHFYAFVPDHSRIDFKQFDPDGTYKVVPYSALFRFFSQHAASYISDRYFSEFLRGLGRHSLTMSELNYRIMRQRFMRKIALAQ